MKNIKSKTVVLIHGAFVNYECWDEWKVYFEQKGYNVIVPPWPYKNSSAVELRNRHPDAEVASLRLTSVVDHYYSIIRSLPENPILIGHSMGGLMVQLLLQRGVGAAGIAIHSVPPQGVITFKFSFLRATWGPLGFFTSARYTYMMPLSSWQYAFTNGMTMEEQECSYYKFAVPESKQLVRDGLTSAAAIDFSNPHAPLLFMSGSKDHIMPASLNYSNYKRYTNKNSITDYKMFEGKNHYVLGQPGWQQHVEYILQWLQN